MVKHTQIIRRLLPTNCLSVLDHYVGLALKRGKEPTVTYLFILFIYLLFILSWHIQLKILPLK